MDSSREPLPPIVDERLIEEPFEIAVLGQSYVARDESAEASSTPSIRDQKRAQRTALKQARLEAKRRAKLDGKVAKVAIEPPVEPEINLQQPSIESVDLSSLFGEAAVDEAEPESTRQVRDAPLSGRNLSFDDLIEGKSE